MTTLAAGSGADSGFMDYAHVTEQSVIANLCRDACSDRFFLSHASESEIAAVVERSVRELWTASKVKSFVGVLALRDVRGVLVDAACSPGLPGTPPEPRPRVALRRSRSVEVDEMSLSDDGSTD